MHALHDRDGDVRDGAEALPFGEHLLREREEARVFRHEEPHGSDEIVGSPLVRRREVEVEPCVVPLDEDERGEPALGIVVHGASDAVVGRAVGSEVDAVDPRRHGRRTVPLATDIGVSARR